MEPATSIPGDSQKWADIEAEEDFAPTFDTESGSTGFQTQIDKDGIKTVTNYTNNKKGETVKTVKRVKVTRKHQRINRAVNERKQRMVKFGLEATEIGEEQDKAYAARPLDNYIIEVPKGSKSASLRKAGNELDDVDQFYFMDLNVNRPTRELKLKFKQLREDDEPLQHTDGLGEGGRGEGADSASRSALADNEPKPAGRYVPPAKRLGRDGGQDGKSMEQQQKEECTVRVTNLSEDVKEDDLKELFGSAGKVHRIYLAKHKETKYSKGFAFITYNHRGDAARAIDKLNRHGYDNLLLNVEWAKPSNRDRQP